MIGADSNDVVNRTQAPGGYKTSDVLIAPDREEAKGPGR